MKSKSIGKNAIANGLKTLCSVLFPLISYPYVATILQVDNLGKYSFSYSIINYFYLLSSLGIATYAIREGSKIRENKNDFSIFASEIFTINIASTVSSYFILFFVLLYIPQLHIYSVTISILSITMFFSLLGCEWIYSVYEEYMYITIRTVLFQLISLLLLFLLVKDVNDVNVYAGIIVLAASGAQLMNFIYLRKHCNITIRFSKSILKHIKPILIMFAGTLTISIYVSSDMTILGFISGDYEVGLYAISTKIYTIIKQIMSGIIIVSIPRLSFYLGNRLNDEFIKLCNKIVYILTFLLMPTIIGVIILSRNIIVFISDESYLDASCSLVILGWSLLVCLYNWFYTSCVLIPNNKERVVLIITLIASVINVGLNFIFIPLLNEIGAAITTFIAEACSLILCAVYSRTIYIIRLNVRFVISVVIGCVYIAIVCLIVRDIVEFNTAVIVISIFISTVGYCVIELLLKNIAAVEMLKYGRLLIGKWR